MTGPDMNGGKYALGVQPVDLLSVAIIAVLDYGEFCDMHYVAVTEPELVDEWLDELRSIHIVWWVVGASIVVAWNVEH